MDAEIGADNIIEEGVTIHDNVKIGNRNLIKRGTVIYPHTTIGDDNVILEDNQLGTLPVEANHDYKEIYRGGLSIGNGNFFHVRNIISSGFYNQTRIGNYNKLLSDVYISHDNIIHDQVTFYPRVFSAGLIEYFDCASIGAGCCVHQKIKIGAYSMLGMNGVATKDVLPFMVNINNKYTRLNIVRFTEKIKEHQNELKEVADHLMSTQSKYDAETLVGIIKKLPAALKTFYEPFFDIFPKRRIVFLSRNDWANVSTILSKSINQWSHKYVSDIICIAPHRFKYDLPHPIDLVHKKVPLNTIKDMLHKADLIIYCEEVNQEVELRKLLPGAWPIIQSKKRVVYHASYKFNNATDEKKYLRQIFVPEIYFMGIPGRKSMIIPGCPITIPENIREIIKEREKRSTIIVLHINSRQGQEGIQYKGTNVIQSQMDKILKKYPQVEFKCIRQPTLTNHQVMEMKKQCDIYIDQYNPTIGGFGVSSVESITFGCLTLSTMNKIDPIFKTYFYREGFFPISPITSEQDLFEQLDALCCLPKTGLVEKMRAQIAWIRRNLTTSYINYYEQHVLDPLFPPS
jgi:acyl-[acyl carrier protein]--UDP-N-acetylglucosamine O-acyltransferase